MAEADELLFAELVVEEGVQRVGVGALILDQDAVNDGERAPLGEDLVVREVRGVEHLAHHVLREPIVGDAVLVPVGEVCDASVVGDAGATVVEAVQVSEALANGEAFAVRGRLGVLRALLAVQEDLALTAPAEEGPRVVQLVKVGGGQLGQDIDVHVWFVDRIVRHCELRTGVSR